MRQLSLLFTLLLVLAACSDEQGFTGASQSKEKSPKAGKVDGVEKKTLTSNEPKDSDAKPQEKSRDTDVDESLKIDDTFTDSQPNDAVTKGSFTVWTQPADPFPGQDYQIVIEVKLPQVLANYPRSDLTGRVVGTDAYQQSLNEGAGAGIPTGPGGFPGSFAANHSFQHFGNKARLSVWVPGAMTLVQDTIEVRSDVLNEDQVIQIVF